MIVVPARNRSRYFTEGPVGSAVPLAGGLSPQAQPAGRRFDECIDVVGSWNTDNPLTIRHSYQYSWVSSGKIGPNWWLVTNWKGGTPSWTGETDPNIPTDSTLITRGLARSNPSRPGADLPLALIELKDIPRMLKGWADTLAFKPMFAGRKNLKELPRASAQNYIEYQFGIQPFLNDLAGVLSFQKSVAKKLRMLEKMAADGGQSREASVYSSEIVRPVSAWTPVSALYQENRYFKYQDTFARKFWTSTRWEPTISVPETAEDKLLLAIRLAYGLDISYSTLWNAMPWTWLFDWFTNVGEVIDSQRNSFPAKPRQSCLMKTVVLTRKTVATSVPSGSVLELWYPKGPQLVFKGRTLIASTPERVIRIPFLTDSQTAILGSLAVLRGRRN